MEDYHWGLHPTKSGADCFFLVALFSKEREERVDLEREEERVDLECKTCRVEFFLLVLWEIDGFVKGLLNFSCLMSGVYQGRKGTDGS